MGFRSTFVTEDFNIQWPEWFLEKNGRYINLRDDHTGVLSSKHEIKIYDDDLPKDIQKAIDWGKFSLSAFVIVFLHECGGITRCQIGPDYIRWSEPDSWHETNQVEHDYCYGCSDLSKEPQTGQK